MVVYRIKEIRRGSEFTVLTYDSLAKAEKFIKDAPVVDGCRLEIEKLYVCK